MGAFPCCCVGFGAWVSPLRSCRASVDMGMCSDTYEIAFRVIKGLVVLGAGSGTSVARGWNLGSGVRLGSGGGFGIELRGRDVGAGSSSVDSRSSWRASRHSVQKSKLSKRTHAQGGRAVSTANQLHSACRCRLGPLQSQRTRPRTWGGLGAGRCVYGVLA